jgi:16S rRNA (cytosine967-C5)-methyltransferase
VPDWLWQRWSAAYGADEARRIAEASLSEAALDISVKPGAVSATAWAERLGGRMLPTGSVRLVSHGRIEDLPGYAEGAWWVQDAAAALVTRIAGDVAASRLPICVRRRAETADSRGGCPVTAVDAAAARPTPAREP